jgi:hypothetical protein
MLVNSFCIAEHNTENNIKILLIRTTSVKDWIVHLKIITVLLCIMRKSQNKPSIYIEEYFSSNLSINKTTFNDPRKSNA